MTRGEYAKLQLELAKAYCSHWQTVALTGCFPDTRKLNGEPLSNDDKLKDAIDTSRRHIVRMFELIEFIASDEAKEPLK